MLAFLFTLSDYDSTRNNGVKLNKTRCCSVRDANFFSNRIVNIWNALPHYIVQTSSITSFNFTWRILLLNKFSPNVDICLS